MPMPPPRPSTEAARDRVVAREISQLRRALREEGPQTLESLAELVGARFWDDHHYERALVRAIADGFIVRTTDDRITVS